MFFITKKLVNAKPLALEMSHIWILLIASFYFTVMGLYNNPFVLSIRIHQIYYNIPTTMPIYLHIQHINVVSRVDQFKCDLYLSTMYSVSRHQTLLLHHHNKHNRSNSIIRGDYQKLWEKKLFALLK